VLPPSVAKVSPQITNAQGHLRKVCKRYIIDEDIKESVRKAPHSCRGQRDHPVYSVKAFLLLARMRIGSISNQPTTVEASISNGSLFETSMHVDYS
jgi:hypothetical protein